MVDLLYHNTYCKEEISENDINTLKKWAINTPSKSSFGLHESCLRLSLLVQFSFLCNFRANFALCFTMQAYKCSLRECWANAVNKKASALSEEKVL